MAIKIEEIGPSRLDEYRSVPIRFECEIGT